MANMRDSTRASSMTRYDDGSVWRSLKEELGSNLVDQAIGITAGEKGVQVISKKAGAANKPASSLTSVNYNKTSRKSVDPAPEEPRARY